MSNMSEEKPITWYMEHIKKLGYERRNTGRWVCEIQDDGQGFPRTVFTCPFCTQVSDYDTRYCPYCGARLNDEAD